MVDPDYKSVNDMRFCEMRFWFHKKTHRFIYCYHWKDENDTAGSTLFGNDKGGRMTHEVIIEVGTVTDKRRRYYKGKTHDV